MILRQFLHFDPVGASYLLGCGGKASAAVIDPIRPVEPYLESAAATGMKILYVIDTHIHADHISSGRALAEASGAKYTLFAGAKANFDFHRVDDGSVLELGNVLLTVMHTPGHTPACIAYVIGDAVFVGDTMFMPDYGTARADFPGGDARALFRSLRRILELPPQTRLFMCHDYLPASRSHYQWETTVAAERRDNIHAHDGVSEDAFVAMREARDRTLDVPRLILPSVQVNMRAGHLPPPEENGVRYLKIPVNAI
ncbi:MBL fold metallo-hydrolase [Devosia sp.]|uniref:MBL fold metallo-hydrolase n=1 Tax=Devosia sp. TaxID=1871048 RepID=UPI001AD36663|nr:MBL fold metallo-hydrolase [Devosia sp.]MBN9333306.1 MBL fold metallo-hydrolase [Devosia sp.]